MSDSVRPHRRQPTRLPCPWDSLGKNTGVGCQFLLQCMKVKSESEVTQLCSTLCDPLDCSLPRLPCPWEFPGKSTGVGCHCLLRDKPRQDIKSRDTIFCCQRSKCVVFPVVIYDCDGLTRKKAEYQKFGGFEWY